MAKTDERIKPIKITDNESGKVYELDFCRESVKFAEARGFKPEEVADYPVTKFPEFFFYAFRMHHKEVARSQTDKLFERLGGFSPNFLERLMLLYEQARTANLVVETDEEVGKNGNLGVELE